MHAHLEIYHGALFAQKLPGLFHVRTHPEETVGWVLYCPCDPHLLQDDDKLGYQLVKSVSSPHPVKVHAGQAW